MPISFIKEDEIVQDGQISFTETVPGTEFVLLPEDVEKRATNYDFAMGEKSLGVNYYRDSLVQGRDKFERDQASLQEEIEARLHKQDLIREFFKQKRGETLSPEDMEFIDNLGSDELRTISPETVFERKYGRQALAQAKMEDAERNDPSFTERLKASTADLVAKQQKLVHKLQELQGKYDKESLATGIVSNLSTFLPFYSWAYKSDAIEEAQASAFLPGNNVQEQRDWFLNNPLEQTWPAVERAVDAMYDGNPVEAIAFLSSLNSYSASSQFLDNALGVGDLSLFAPVVGVVPFAAYKGVATGTARAISRAVASGEASPNIIAYAAGNIETAAFSQAVTKLLEKAGATQQARAMSELIGEVQTLYNPAAITGAPTNAFSTEATQRIERALRKQGDDLLGTISESTVIERIATNSEALRVAMEAAKRTFNIEYPSAVDQVLDVIPVNAASGATGVDAIAVRIGSKEALPFAKKGAATNTARNILKLREFEVVPTGDNQWVIQHVKFIDESVPQVRDLIVPTDMPTPVNMRNIVLGFIRSPQGLVSKDIYRDMLTATYGSSALLKRVQDVGKSIAKINKTKLNDFLNYQKDFIDAEGKRGWNSRTLADFETDWYARFGDTPSEQEALAYFSVRQLLDYDYMVRNLSFWRDRTRLGLENHVIRFKSVVPKISRRGGIEKAIESEPIMGKTVQRIPWEEHTDAGIAILNPDTGELEFFRKNIKGSSKDGRDSIDQYTKRGYKIIQLTRDGWEALKNTTGIKNLPRGNVKFLLARDVETKPLPLRQIPYRAGSHVEYMPGYYMRQAHVERNRGLDGIEDNVYYGDRNIFHFLTEEDAKFWTPKMEEARQLLLKGDEAATRAYVENTLPMSWNRFMQYWISDSNPTGLLDPETPIMYSRSDVSLARDGKLKNYTNFREDKDSPYNLEKGVNFEYAGERDRSLSTIVREGSPEAPLYRMEPARTIDPLPLLHRNTTSLLRSRYLDDLKIKTAERFIQEFGDLLRTDKAILRQNPAVALFDPDWINGANPERLMAAKHFRRTVVEFLGMESRTSQVMNMFRQKIAEQIMNRLGQKGFKLAKPFLMHTIKDPVTRMRQFTFDLNLGLFNPVQLFLQGQLFTHTLAIEGVQRTTQSAGAAAMYHFLRFGHEPAMMKQAAKTAGKFGWKAEEFQESYEAFIRSGLYHVGPEHAFRDTLLNEKIYQGKLGAFFDWGRVFFNAGERWPRAVAWAAAYRRWRDANPGKRLNARAESEILDRANTLIANMSRAGAAPWQKGWISPATQFFSFQARLMEQMLGKELTVGEKTRLFTLHSMMYGVPVAAGAWVGGVFEPAENIREYLVDKGIEYDGTVMEPLVDGILSTAAHMTTGTKFNVGKRYGPGGLPWLREIWRGDIEFAELIFGASASSLENAATSGSPFFKLFASIFNGKADEYYPLTPKDFLNVLRTARTGDQFTMMWDGLTTGQWFNKTGGLIGDVTEFESVMKGFFGLTPVSMEDMYRRTSITRRIQERQKSERLYAIEAIQAGVKALGEDDLEGFNTFWKKAHIHMEAGGFTPKQRIGIAREAANGNENMFEENMKKWMASDPKRIDDVIRLKRKRRQELGETPNG